MSALIRETQGLLPGQIDLTEREDLLKAARRMEFIRCEKKGGWQTGPNRGSHFWGALGEIYVCQTLFVEPDWEQKTGDGGIDGNFHGITFDVKLSTYVDDPHLKFPVTSKYHADIYILVVADQDTLKLQILGWATIDEIKASPVKNYKPSWKKDNRFYPDNYVVSPERLHPIEDLFDMESEGMLENLKSAS